MCLLFKNAFHCYLIVYKSIEQNKAVSVNRHPGSNAGAYRWGAFQSSGTPEVNKVC